MLPHLLRFEMVAAIMFDVVDAPVRPAGAPPGWSQNPLKLHLYRGLSVEIIRNRLGRFRTCLRLELVAPKLRKTFLPLAAHTSPSCSWKWFCHKGC